MNGAPLPPRARRGGGMQVHAVPENERAIDPKTGQRLPWAYEYADPDRANQRRVPEERGPFGRPTNRRGPSRSKTFTPVSKKEDKDAAENWRAIDDIFTRAKQESGTARAAEGAGQQATTQAGVPTEVILYGFLDAYQYAAVEFYERVSSGVIYEDYERMPPNTRFDLTLSRSTGSRGLKVPAEALAKVNRYHGGEHWIKVTFDSAEAADRACHYSPHTLHGYMVYAERYRGDGPTRDEAIPATKERLASVRSSPSQAPSSSTVKALSSTTVSTATADASDDGPSTPTAARTQPSGAVTSSFSSQTEPGQQLQQRAPKIPLIKGASRAVLLPAESALLPSSSRWQRLFGAWPIIGIFFGGSSQDMIGNELPRKEDGTFDWDNASLYWWIWALLDYYLFFANFLGLKGDE